MRLTQGDPPIRGDRHGPPPRQTAGSCPLLALLKRSSLDLSHPHLYSVPRDSPRGYRRHYDISVAPFFGGVRAGGLTIPE